jgi:hypothetical protein
VPGISSELDKVWAMVLPDPSASPVMAPEGESTAVQLKVVPLVVELSAILVVAPEQMLSDDGVAVMDGVGLTVMVKVVGVPVQVVPPLALKGKTEIVAVTGEFPLLVAVKEGIFPVPEAASPMDVLVLVQL